MVEYIKNFIFGSQTQIVEESKELSPSEKIYKNLNRVKAKKKELREI